MTAIKEPLIDRWRAIQERHWTLSCALERELQDRHGIGLSEFEALERLVEGGKDSYRAQELTDALPLSQSAASRVVARLEKRGMVSRGMCEMDRRGISICLTDAGRECYRAARPTHRAVLDNLLS